MNMLTRSTVVALVVGLLTLGVVGLRLQCSSSDSEERGREEQLQRLEKATILRRQARRQAAQEYISRRCTLMETIRRFQELEQEWPDYSNFAPEPLSGSGEERHFQIILEYVKLVLSRRPEELAPILRRLEKDYRQIQAGRQAPSPVATERAERKR